MADSTKTELRACRRDLLAAVSRFTPYGIYLSRDAHMFIGYGQKRFWRRGIVTVIARIPEDEVLAAEASGAADVVMHGYATWSGTARFVSLPVPVRIEGETVTFPPMGRLKRSARRDLRRSGVLWAEPAEIRGLIAEIEAAEDFDKDGDGDG